MSDKLTGTFKEFVKAQDSLTPLQKAVEKKEKILEWFLMERKQPNATVMLTVQELKLFVDAAKQLSALQIENEGLMLRSVAAMHIAEEEDYSSIPIDCPMLGEVLKLRQDRDSFKSTLESTRVENVKMREALIDELPTLVCSFTIYQHLPSCDSYNNPEKNWCGICKRRKRVNNTLSTTPPTNADNSKDVK